MRRCALRVIPVILLLVSLAVLRSRPGESVPLYAARQALMCQTCHFDPNGGGPRNDFGFAFARSRHSLEPEDSSSVWHDLSVSNRVGESMPLYVGVNQRFMLLANTSVNGDSLDRLGFFNMENSIHFAFQPHPRLTLVYSMDAFTSSPGIAGNFRSKEAFGMIEGFIGNGYLKAGRIRSPFGLRYDDHTVATRNGFLEGGAFPGQRFLPYDPRYPDMGVEAGMERNGIFGRLALTNGEADVISAGQYAGAKTLKVGYNNTYYQGALSFYDDYRKESFSGIKRATRWGYYGMTHYGPAALIGEITAGTDEAEPVVPGTVSGPKTNLLAGNIEADYAANRSLNVRVRYDHLVTDRSSDPRVRDAATHKRIGFEAEWVPVPFAELRLGVRNVVHEDEKAYQLATGGLGNETQAFLQFHFSY